MKNNKIIKSMATIFFLIFFSFNSTKVYAENSIKVNLKVGYDSAYKIGYTAPINIEIENKLKDINGEIQIEMINYSGNITLYSTMVNIPVNSTRNYRIEAPIMQYMSTLKVNILDGKNVVYSEKLPINLAASGDSFLIGILSDDFDSINYINQVLLKNNSQYSARSTKLDEKIFSENEDSLEVFNVIIINNYDTSKLSTKQYASMKKWVKNGGMLLIGTGPSYNKTLSLFKDDFISGKIGNEEDINTNVLNTMIFGTKEQKFMKLNITNMDIKDSEAFLSDNNKILINKIERGNGVIAVAAFDFGLSPISNWNYKSNFAGKIIGNLIPNKYQNLNNNKGMGNINNDAYQISSALRTIPELPIPKSKNIFWMFIIYIVLVSPLSYFILKKIDKRELMWITVPILSLIFSIVMYYAGYSTRLTKPITNIISYISFSNTGGVNVNTYGGIFTPSKSNIKVEGSSEINIKPILTNNNYGGYNPNNPPKIIDSKVVLSPKHYIEFYKTGIFTNRTVSIDSNIDIKGKFIAGINFSDKKFTGEVSNNTNLNLEDCYFVTQDSYIKIGDIKNGESKKIDDSGTSLGNKGGRVVDAIYGMNMNNNGTKINYTEEQLKKLRENQQKMQVLNDYFNRSGNSIEPMIIGWSKDKLCGDIFINGKKSDVFEKSFVTLKVPLSFVKGNSVEYPFGYIKPNVVVQGNRGGYDEFGRMLFGSGPFLIDFNIDKTINVQSIDIKYTVNNNNSAMKTKSYIWNAKSANWEEKELNGITLSEGSINNYLEGNVLKIKFEGSDDSNIHFDGILLKGSVK